MHSLSVLDKALRLDCFLFTDTHQRCSRVWQPLTDSFLLIIVSLWLLEIIGIVVMLITSIRKSLLVMNPARSISSHSLYMSNRNVYGSKSTENMSNLDNTANSISGISHCRSVSNMNLESPNTHQGGRLSCCYSCNVTIKFLVIIFLLFLVTTSPVIVVILIDVISKDYVLPPHSVPWVVMLSMWYGLISPVILVCYMPRLRLAVQGLFVSIKCCTRITIRQDNNNDKK
ncbi:unnamed protein product [Clavelina lepadiformis]|uniref:G-protein coupled receptors family 1 profile domain-containing protein n=1 Tax=Clavelina lepadiformis TaxID=159417 RepID=A0ABP0G484_CLALP